MYIARTAPNTMMRLAFSNGETGLAQCKQVGTKEKREVLPSLVSPNGEVDYVTLIDITLTNRSIRLSAVRTYCFHKDAGNVIVSPYHGVATGGDVSVVEVGFGDELLLAPFALYLDYLAHHSSSLNEHPHHTDATAINVL